MSNIVDLTDGRTARRAGNRQRMLAVGLNIMRRTGCYRVTPKEVADGAGMHLRSFHVIFNDLEGFYQAMFETHEASLREMINRDVKDKDKSLVRLVLLGK